jgi:hypothetical protein
MDLFIGEEGQMHQDDVGVCAACGVPNPFSAIWHSFAHLSVTADVRETPSIMGILIVYISL